MAVIYLPPNEGPANFANMLAGINQGYQQTRALQDTQGMDPSAQAAELMKRLGPDGAKFVSELLKVRQSEAEIRRSQQGILESQSRIKEADVMTGLNQFKLDHADEDLKLKHMEEMARIRLSNAEAAGAGSRAALAQEEITDLREKRARSKQEDALTDALRAPLLSSILGGASGQGGGTGQAPAPSSEGGSPPSPQPIPLGGAAPGAAGGTPQTGQGPEPARSAASDRVEPGSLRFVEQLEQTGRVPGQSYAGEGKGAQQVTLDPATALELAGALSSKDKAAGLMRAGQVMGRAATPEHITTKEVPNAPGFTQDYGVFKKPDGSVEERPIPGSLQRSKSSVLKVQDLAAATGASQLYQTMRILKQFDEAESNPNPKDPLGGYIKRQANQMFMQHGQDPPFGDDDQQSISKSRFATVQHTIAGLSNYMKGSARGQYIIKIWQDMSPQNTDSLGMRLSKEKALDSAMRVFVGGTVGDMLEEGKRVPQTLKSMYHEMGLDGKDLADLRREYFQSLQATGKRTAIDPETGDVVPVPGAGRSPAGAPGKSAPGGLPPGWKVVE